MTRIHVLSPGFTNPNSIAFLFPLLAFKSALKNAGYSFKIFTSLSEALCDCDILLIDGKFLMEDWQNRNSLETLQNLSQKTTVIWCDQSDSTGTLFGQALPFVHKYLKAQLLADLNNYQKPYYGDRIYTDYYHRRYGVNDDIHYHYESIQSENDFKKIGLSWNSGLMNYGRGRPYLMQIWKVLPFQPCMRFSFAVTPAITNRPLPLSCRMGASYPRNTVSYQRKRLREILVRYIATDKLSHACYLAELAHAKICVSPFGYGEITLKDFETFLCGALLLKPDMSHMWTWPNFFEKDVTYAAHSWDMDDVEEVIENLLRDEKRRTDIAASGQKRYLKYTTDSQAPERFVRHFQAAIKI